MFIRFRSDGARLYVSLVRTRRVEGKVRQEHVASLGSITVSPSVADRIAFWARLHERLAKLSNRIDAAAQGKVMGDIHARVPIVTPDEQRDLQLENAKVDVDQWSVIRDLTAAKMADKEQLVAKVEANIAADKAVVSTADDATKKAQGRVAAIERGEIVEGGLGKPQDWQELFKAAGITEADRRHAELLASIPEDRWREFLDLFHRAMRRADRRISTRAARTILRKLAKVDQEAPHE